MDTDLRVEDVAEETQDATSSKPATRLVFRLFLGSVVAAVVPIAVAAARAIHDGWIPTEDNALFPVRARDVFSITHLPLIGTWSSASLTAGTNLNHPGPLYFDLLAVPARLVDSGAGIAFGVALINALCVGGIAVFAYRRGGALVGTVAMTATAALCWTMGSEVLFEPWNPHSVLLPFLFFLVLVWSLACGDLVALPFAAAVGSLVVQTHLSYVLLVPLLGALGVVGLCFWLRQERRDTGAWPARRRHALRFAALGGAVLAVCWIQPLIEQFTSDGRGNLTRLADSLRASDADTVGYGFGTRVVATVVSLPPWWFRPSMNEAFIPGWRAPSLGLAVLSLVVVGAMLAWCAWDARRRHDRVCLWAVGTAIFALLTALVTAGQGPITVFGKVTAHTFRWLWPLAAFAFFAVVLTVARRLGRVVAPASLTGFFALATVAVAALNLPFADQGRGPNSRDFAYAQPAARDLGSNMGSLEGRGPLLIDDLFRGAFADPYGAAVVAELQRRGISFVARDPVLVRQYGPGRRFNGRNAKAAILLRQGEATIVAPPGSRPVARGQGLSAAEVRELARLKRQIGDYIGQRGLTLNSRGDAALDAGKLPTLARSSEQPLDVQALFATRELDLMIRHRYVALDDPWAERFTRYADLQQGWDQKTVALFIAPVGTVTPTRT
ncbi:MAG TPA: hypothetical protein VGK05_00220 [Acidimicrobiia bacterium]